EAAQNHGANPQRAAADIEAQVPEIGHRGSAGNGRAKGANDGDEARENHRPASVFLIKIVSALEVAAAEEERIFAAIQRWASGATNTVADLIADDGAQHDRQEQPAERNHPRCGENTRSDQERVARK